MNEKGLPPILKILPFPPRNMKICGFPLFSRIFFDTIWFFPNSSRIKHLFLEIASKLLNKERRKTTHIKALFQIFRAGSITTCQLFWNPSRIDSDCKKFDWSKCFGLGESDGWILKPKWYSNQRVYCAGLLNHF